MRWQDVGRIPLEPFYSLSSFGRLEPEHLLDLVPDGEEKDDPDHEEQEDHHREAQACARLLPLAADARVAPRTVVVVRAVDSSGIERWVFGGALDAAERLGH